MRQKYRNVPPVCLGDIFDLSGDHTDSITGLIVTWAGRLGKNRAGATLGMKGLLGLE